MKNPIHYLVSIASIASHIFEVELHITKASRKGHLLSLPAWIPGSYMIRDFAKNIIGINAHTETGEYLALTQLDKQTWQLPPHDGSITLNYQVYAFDLSVRQSYICDQFAFFNGTSVFVEVKELSDSPCSVTVLPLKGHDWQVATAMRKHKLTQANHFGEYQADNYQDLIEHPVLMGKLDIFPFTVTNPADDSQSVDFALVFAGGQQSDTTRMISDLSKICQHHLAFFADRSPFDRYLFLTMLSSEGFGGLEHTHSTALLYSRDDLPSLADKDTMPKGYRTFLSLCSHELFHTWHVKRIKPQELATANLASEAYTEQLWIYEGFTSYYDDLSLLRCGIISQQEYLELMGQNLSRLRRNPGREKQSISESSFTAWSKFYKQDEAAINNIVSYYNKGAVLAMCLDLLMRKQSNHQYSLDDLMRHLWLHFGAKGIATQTDEIHKILRDQSALDVESFLQEALYTTHDLPSDMLLEQMGIKVQYRAREGIKDLGGTNSSKNNILDFGAIYKACDTGIKLSQVIEKSSAHKAGLQVGDQLVAINGWQVNADKFSQMLSRYPLNEHVSLDVLRDQRMLKLSMTITPAPLDTVYLEIGNQTLSQAWLLGSNSVNTTTAT